MSSRVLIVVVLYRVPPAESKTVLGLGRSLAADATLADTYQVLLWDNSAGSLEIPDLPFHPICRRAETNVGVSGAYNAAMQVAHELGCKWMLVLDDDTSVTGEYLSGMREQIAAADGEAEVGAVVPFLRSGNLDMSPRLWRFARHVPLPPPAAPYVEGRLIFAANSGTALRVSALDAIGGYSTRFWLDYSDIELFQRMHTAGYVVRIASGLELQHELALQDYDARMTPARYATYLAAESDFLDLYRGPLERAMHLLRLAVRSVRQRRFKDERFAEMTRKELRRRLTTTRRARLTPRA